MPWVSDNVYCKYYEVVYILFHTGMHISEFCGLTLKDIALENRIINIDHQLLTTSEMKPLVAMYWEHRFQPHGQAVQ